MSRVSSTFAPNFVRSYLTIRRAVDSSIFLGLPNAEVRHALADHYRSTLWPAQKESERNGLMRQFRQAVTARSVEQMQDAMNAMLRMAAL